MASAPNSSIAFLRYAACAASALSNRPSRYLWPSFFISATYGFFRRYVYLPQFERVSGLKDTPLRPVRLLIGTLRLIWLTLADVILKFERRLSSLSPFIWSTTIFFPVAWMPTTNRWTYSFFLVRYATAYLPSNESLYPLRISASVSSIRHCLPAFREISI